MTPAEQLQADVQQILCEPLRVRDGWEGRVDDAIRVVLEAALMACNPGKYADIASKTAVFDCVYAISALLPPEKGE